MTYPRTMSPRALGSRAPLYSATLSFLLIGMLLTCLPTLGQPKVSPAAKVTQTIGLTEVEVTYSRPSVRERQVFGELEPYGKVWRTGANEASTFSTSTDIEVEGKALPAGTYALFTIPGEEYWTIIFNQVAEQWGAFQHDEKKDALRVQVKARKGSHQEQLLIHFPEVSQSSATLSLHWQEVVVPVGIQVDTAKQAFTQAKTEVEAAKLDGNGRAIWNWANYFRLQGTYSEEALGWAKIVSTASPNLYWSWSLQARLEHQAGQKDAAMVTAKKALAMAKEQAESPGVAGDSAALADELASWSK